MGAAETLERLARLRDTGVITSAEFEVEKRKILQRPAVAANPAPLSATSPPNPKSSKGCLWAALVPVFLVASCGVVVALDKGDEGSSDKAAAIQMCRDSVRGKLKAPSTAKFSGEGVVSQSGNLYTVTGAVDAENSFGAKVRTTFTCRAGVDHGTRLNAVATLDE